MAQLNMMGNQWNMGQQPGWQSNNFHHGSHNFHHGSNMSLNMNMQSQNFNPEQQMWNPWMQQQQFQQFPMMPNGELICSYSKYIHIDLLHLSGMPPQRTRSRAASPALSVRSRRSMISSRNRHKYMPGDLTDDEDSEIEMFTDDSRSRVRKSDVRNRSRRNTEQIDLDYRDTEVISRIQRMKEKSKYIRERRSGSLTNWPTTKDRDSGSLTPSDEEIKKISSKYRKSSLTSPVPQNTRLLSDSASEKEAVKEAPNKTKIPPKVVQPVKNDSLSEKETVEDTPVPIESKKVTRRTEDSEPVIKPASTPAKSSETRPLKVANNSVVNSSEHLKTSSSVKEPMLIKVEPKPTQAEKAKEEDRPVENVEPSTHESVEILQPPPSKAEIHVEAPKKASNVAPPPLEDWECQHCTFVNEADAKICTICCKTRVDVLQQLPTAEDDIDINEINDSISQNENDAKQKGKVRKISFLPGTKAH